MHWERSHTPSSFEDLQLCISHCDVDQVWHFLGKKPAKQRPRIDSVVQQFSISHRAHVSWRFVIFAQKRKALQTNTAKIHKNAKEKTRKHQTTPLVLLWTLLFDWNVRLCMAALFWPRCVLFVLKLCNTDPLNGSNSCLIKSSNLLSSVKAASLLKIFFFLHWHSGKISLSWAPALREGFTQSDDRWPTLWLRPSGSGHGIPTLGIPLADGHWVRWTGAKATTDAGMLIHREDLYVAERETKNTKGDTCSTIMAKLTETMPQIVCQESQTQ